jgi:biopolymer transport protein ExbD
MISTNSSSDETGSVVTDLAPGSSAVTGDADENNPAGGGELTIRVSGDTVYIGNEEYMDVNLARPAINEAAKNGAAVILVDDYASARTYIEVKDLLSELGVTDMTEETLD